MDSTRGKPTNDFMNTFGIDFAEKDLGDVFSTCVFCLTQTMEGTANTREMMQLNALRLRLTRWGVAVNIYQEPALGDYDPEPQEIVGVRHTLVNIITLFDTRSLTAKPAVVPQASLDRETRLLQERLGTIVSERFTKENSLVGTEDLGYDGWSEVKSICLSRFIRCLEQSFGSEKLRELCADERHRINDEAALERLRAITGVLDPWLFNEIPREAAFRHSCMVSMNGLSGVQFNNIGSGLQFNNIGSGIEINTMDNGFQYQRFNVIDVTDLVKNQTQMRY